MPEPTPEELHKAVERERAQGQIRSMDVSFHELGRMYQEEELVIKPDYQRGFRWSEQKQSQWIESVLLGFPLPPIYAIELEAGGWELIDGLQRLSSYLHFCGLLHDDTRYPPISHTTRLTLTGCDIVKELNGYTYERLGQSTQYRLRRATIRVELVRKDTNQRYQYYMFKRLNSGGETLSDQEVRNCTIRLFGNDFNAFIRELAKGSDFNAVTSTISDELSNTMFREELVLRFFALKNAPGEFRGLVGPFLTDYLERVTDGMQTVAGVESATKSPLPFDLARERHVFEQTMKALNGALGEYAARRPVGSAGLADGSEVRHLPGFHVRLFDVLALAVAQVAPAKAEMSGEWLARLKTLLIAFKLKQLDSSAFFASIITEATFISTSFPNLVSELAHVLHTDGELSAA